MIRPHSSISNISHIPQSEAKPSVLVPSAFPGSGSMISWQSVIPEGLSVTLLGDRGVE